MNTLDWILAGVLALLAIRCLVRGFVAEVLSVAAYVVGLLAALLLYKPAGALIKDKFGVATASEVIGFVAVFVMAFLVVKLLERMLRQSLEAAHLETADRILGFLLGAAEGLIAISLILIVISIQPLFDAKKLLDGSFFARSILPVVGPEVSKALGGAAQSLPKVELPKVELPKVKKP